MQGNKLVWSIPVLDRQYVKSLLVTVWLQPSTIYLAECCVEICNNVTNTFHAMIRLLLNFWMVDNAPACGSGSVEWVSDTFTADKVFSLISHHWGKTTLRGYNGSMSTLFTIFTLPLKAPYLLFHSCKPKPYVFSSSMWYFKLINNSI